MLTTMSSTCRRSTSSTAGPLLGAGDIYVMFNDSPEVRALMEYFTLPMSVSGFLNDRWRLRASEGCHA